MIELEKLSISVNVFFLVLRNFQWGNYFLINRVYDGWLFLSRKLLIQFFVVYPLAQHLQTKIKLKITKRPLEIYAMF